MKEAPSYAEDPVFKQFYSSAEYINLSKEEKRMYDISVKNRWDYHLVMDAKEEKGKLEGKAEGKLEGKLEVARELKKIEISMTDISKVTGLTIEEIESL